MKEFDYRVRGELSPYGRQSVYFSCHPLDFDPYFNGVAQIVWKDYDCAIWFFNDNVDDENEYSLRLSEMQLFIIPITSNFLLKPNRARDFDLPYALSHNIPVLPLMQESGLDELYAKRCGDLHYIDKNACDITTLTYEQKVRKFLSHVLVDDEMVDKIRHAFYARIFLSYRKKDRALANQLMELIHDIPFCRDISIWFDEYLVPGEHFNEAIKSAMKNSDLFVLCVTENLVNEDNYIQKVEYPEAAKFQLPVVPVISSDMTAKQIEMLQKQYKNIPDCVDKNDQKQLADRFPRKFLDLAVSNHPGDPMHLYFVGLAYLKGIEVEINHAKAVSLITEAANSDYLPAIEKLANMYSLGEGVARSQDKVLEMYTKMIALLSASAAADEKKLFDTLFDVLKFMLDSSALFQNLHADFIKKSTFQILEVANNLNLSDIKIFKLYSMLAFVNAFDDDVFNLFVQKCQVILPNLGEEDDLVLSGKAFFYSRLALIYYEKFSGKIVYAIIKNARREQLLEYSEAYIRKAIALNRKLFRKDPVKWKPNLTETLKDFCLMNYSQPFSSDQDIVEIMECTLQLYQDLCNDNPEVYSEKLASFCFLSAEYLSVELDFVWEKTIGVHLKLDTEKYVPGTPEQDIPLSFAISNDYEEYDVKRIRKALSLMRYGIALYEGCIANDQTDCSPDIVESYYRLARLLTYLLSLIEDVEENTIQAVCKSLFADISHCYQRVLKIHGAYMNVLRGKYPDRFSNKKTNSHPQQSDIRSSSKPSEQELLALEEKAYSHAPLEECYDFAVKLAYNDYADESHHLHADLHHFFKDTSFSGNPQLQLMNLSEHASNIEDIDEALSILLEFDVDRCRQDIRNGPLFDYYYLIATLYLRKNNFSEANQYLGKANAVRKHSSCDISIFYYSWAVCKKNLADLAGAELLILEGIEALMTMNSPPPTEWNKLCREYISILNLLGKTSEAEEWLNELLPEE